MNFRSLNPTAFAAALLAFAAMPGACSADPAVAAAAITTTTAAASETSMVVTGSGLAYQDVKTGTGTLATTATTCVFHYSAELTDGTVADASRRHAPPAPLRFKPSEGGMIQGVCEGIVGMKVGGSRVLTIPAPLAYGRSGKGRIPANATLIFRIDLVDILK